MGRGAGGVSLGAGPQVLRLQDAPRCILPGVLPKQTLGLLPRERWGHVWSFVSYSPHPGMWEGLKGATISPAKWSLSPGFGGSRACFLTVP